VEGYSIRVFSSKIGNKTAPRGEVDFALLLFPERNRAGRAEGSGSFFDGKREEKHVIGEDRC